MPWRVIRVGEAPAPRWVSESLAALPAKPAMRAVYLLSRPPQKPFPALVYAPEKVSSQPAYYYDPETLSLLQVQTAWYRYQARRKRLLRLRARSLKHTPFLSYLAMDENGRIIDYNLPSLNGALRYIGIHIHRGMHYRHLIPPEHIEDFSKDFQYTLMGQAVHATRKIKSRIGDTVLLPVQLGKSKYVVYLAIDTTTYYELMEAFHQQQELAESVANRLREGIFTAQEPGIVTYANAAAEAFIGPELTDRSFIARLQAQQEGLICLRDRLLRWEWLPPLENGASLATLSDVTQTYQAQQESYLFRKAWEIGHVGLALLREDNGHLIAIYQNRLTEKWFPDSGSQLAVQLYHHLSKSARERVKKAISSGSSVEVLLTASYYKRGWSHLRLSLYAVDLPLIANLFLEDSLNARFWQGRIWVAILQDETVLQQVTRRRLLLEARQNRQILQALEQERQRLAEELHDQVGALLSVVRMSLASLSTQGPLPLTERLQELVTRVDEVIRAVRLTSHLLMPPLVEHFGLITILEGLLRRLNQAQVQTHFTLEVVGQERPLSLTHKLHIYRIVQELLNNALRHAQATQVTIRLLFGKRLYLEVRDNGRGYEPRQLSNIGIGLRNIEARLKLLKALWENRSEPGKGAYYRMEIPLPKERNAKTDR